MVCETADEMKAHLTLRGLFNPVCDASAKGGIETYGGTDDDFSCRTALHKRLHAEVDDVLSAGLKKRLERFGKRVGAAGATPPAAASRSPAAPPVVKTFGPTARQGRNTPPPEKVEPIVDEEETLRATLKSLRQSLGSRDRQINNLKKQLVVCQGFVEKRSEDADISKATLESLKKDKAALIKVHKEIVEKHRTGIAEKLASLAHMQKEAKAFKQLAQQQVQYYRQEDLILRATERGERGGPSDPIARHPAGDIFMALAPPPFNENGVEIWDVGCSIANPYVCDSWPFEPNVLAKRCPKDPPMNPCEEETEQDLEEANKPPRRNPFAGSGLDLRLPMCGGADGYDDRYEGPSETARSL
eukprot:gnl/TRDRNA2_/TRDRNA2_191858_c0_seq1.p1 gnl/TRDRNA2_/TRDRNA2_191858_c0~~gnl/TRDRNA2_/TRDRNA2_191858_c0_seq1.p1  ORF type:complete len:358 (+),score=75.47 gnl/TRDRNA2_/TRDRNA2_191858_c0_seq1:41-1114(+)